MTTAGHLNPYSLDGTRGTWIERACGALLPGSPDPTKDRRIDEAPVERLDQRHVERGEPGHGVHIDRPVQTISVGRLCQHGRQEGVHRRVPHLGQRLSLQHVQDTERTVPCPGGQRRTTVMALLSRWRDDVSWGMCRSESQPHSRLSSARSAKRPRTMGVAARTFSRARSARTSAIVPPAPPPGRSTAVTSWSGTSLKRPWTARRRLRNCSRGTRILCDPPSPVV